MFIFLSPEPVPDLLLGQVPEVVVHLHDALGRDHVEREHPVVQAMERKTRTCVT